jgi:hypothetical protein
MNNWQVLGEMQIRDWHRDSARHRMIVESRAARQREKQAAGAPVCGQRWELGLMATLRWLTCRVTRATA